MSVGLRGPVDRSAVGRGVCAVLATRFRYRAAAGKRRAVFYNGSEQRPLVARVEQGRLARNPSLALTVAGRPSGSIGARGESFQVGVPAGCTGRARGVDGAGGASD